MKIVLLGCLLLTSPFAFARVGCLTSKCHDDLTHGNSVHGPVKAKGCLICHDGKNVSTNPKLPQDHPPVSILPSDNKGIDSTCVLCHDTMKSLLTSKTGDVHKPVQTKGCLECHNPHHSKHPKLLKKAYGSDGCISCHDDIKKIAEQSTHPHSKIYEKESCSLCHSAHGATGHPALLKKTITATCQNCHKNEPHANKTECTSCHAVHGNNEPSLLKGRYTDQFHATFDIKNSELCFKCHKTELVTDASTTTTGFRNGEKNLHHIHLTGDKKVRTCRSCHSPHHTKQEKLIETWIPYNKMLLPLEFNKSPTGGTCASACHGKLSYDRINEVKNAPKR